MSEKKQLFAVTKYRVIYGDTDKMGVVYYANYLRFFEAARNDLLRSIGTPYKEMEEQGYFLPIKEVKVEYKKPIYYDDEIEIETKLAKISGPTVEIVHKITKSGEVMTEGKTLHYFVDSAFKVVRPPNWFTEKFADVLCEQY